MKRFLLSLLLCLLCYSVTFAQEQVVTLQLKKNATEIKFSYRLANLNDRVTIDFGQGETATLQQTKAGELMQFSHTFATPSTEARTVSIPADKLITFRVTSSKTIEGVLHIISDRLEYFNCDFTELKASAKLDFTQCPALKEITLNSSDVEEVVFPRDPSKIETFQWGLPVFPTATSRQLKDIDFKPLTGLTNLALQGVAMRTIDLTNCPNMTDLIITGASKSNHPRKLIGAKKMKHLKNVILQMCGFSYDMLPDLNETELDKFKVQKMYFTYVDRSAYNDMTVDLSYLATAKGIAETPQPTVFTWSYKDSAGKWQPIPEEKITSSKPGIFTFDKSLLDPTTKTVTVRAKLFNAGYPDLSFYKSGLNTSNMTLPNLTPTITLGVTKESLGTDDEGDDIEEFEISIQVAAVEAGTQISVDWGDGNLVPYTIDKANEPRTLSNEVSIGSMIKIYGPVTQIDASRSHIISAEAEAGKSVKVLRLSANAIKELDLSPMPNLIELQVTSNQLTQLDLSQTPLLEELYCGYNKLSSLDVQVTPRLSVLNCNDNQITALDFAALPLLEIATLSSNPLPKQLDLSSNSKLRVLDIEHCKIESLKLNAPHMERFWALDNQLRTLRFTPELMPHEITDDISYNIDLRNNLLEACDINDLLMTLPIHLDGSELKYILKLAGNPGAATYDDLLLGYDWNVDMRGNSTGCDLIRLVDVSRETHGTAHIMIGADRKELGERIPRRVNAVIVLVPEAGYAPKSCMIGVNELKASEQDPAQFAFVAEHNAFVEYTFQKDNSVELPSGEHAWIYHFTDRGFEIDTPIPHTHFQLYNASGALCASGYTDAGGRIQCQVSPGIYLLQLGTLTTKIAF